MFAIVTQTCPKITDNPYVIFAKDHWELLVIILMFIWITKRGVR
jgi:hypothetical protein